MLPAVTPGQQLANSCHIPSIQSYNALTHLPVTNQGAAGLREVLVFSLSYVSNIV